MTKQDTDKAEQQSKETLMEQVDNASRTTAREWWQSREAQSTMMVVSGWATGRLGGGGQSRLPVTEHAEDDSSMMVKVQDKVDQKRGWKRDSHSFLSTQANSSRKARNTSMCSILNAIF